MATAFTKGLELRTWLIAMAAGLCGAQSVLAVVPLPEATTDEPVIAPVTTHHQVRIGDDNVRYAATFGEMLLNDARDKPQATISATSYVREVAGDVSQRPVLFLFNGGPGASSSPLHFGAFGPRRWAGERDASGARRLIDNPQSLVDVADLVFIDPVGTGFSRERAGAESGVYWSVEGDARAALQLIRSWLRDNKRTHSPVFIAGQSYGGFRIAMMMRDAADLAIGGLVLISPALDISGSSGAPGNDQPNIFNLPTMAVAAWHHGRTGARERTIEQVFEEATEFAQTEYAVALQRGWELSAAERDRIAARMSALIGLPAETIVAANLRIDSQAFLDTLLAANGLVLGRLDTRVTAPVTREVPNADRPAGANDPALGLGRSNVIRSEPIRKYFHDELAVSTKRDYFSLTLDVNFRWNWRGESTRPELYVNPTVNIAQLMQKQPQTRLLLLGGYFDLSVPVLAPRYALARAGVPRERVLMAAFAAGHSPFEGEANLARIADLMRTFVQGSTVPGGHASEHRDSVEGDDSADQRRRASIH